MWAPSVGRPRKGFTNVASRMIGPEKEKANEVSLMENLQEYCRNTTIHGLRYIGTNSLSLFERIFFSISFALVSVLSIYFITNVYQKWQSNPIIIGLNPTATHIRDIPFPAITICNMNQAKRAAAEKMVPNSQEYSLLDSICSLDGEFNATNKFQGKWSVVKALLLNATQSCSKMIVACRYAQKVQKCMHLFSRVLTDEGRCCTFNSVHQSFMLRNYDPASYADAYSDEDNPFEPIEWIPEGGYVGELRNNSYPRPIAGPGVTMGLAVVLDANVSDYFCSSTSSSGFKLLLHNPTETPKMAEYASYIQVGTENRIVVQPKLSDASYLIRKVAQDQRQCVFANEANLSYFRTYSRNNCEMECEARLILEFCGCVLYYMPRIQEDVKVCSKADAGCYEEIKSSIAFTANTSLRCSCLPGCFEINYSMDITSANLCIGKFKINEKLLTQTDAYARENIALLYIYFTETYFRSFTKGELVGFTDFVSNIGGLLGLFMGFSLISLAELLYFVTLRPLFAKRRERKQREGAREREFNVFYNSVFQVPNKQQSGAVLFVDEEVNPIRNLSQRLKVFIGSRLQQAAGWIENVIRMRKNPINSKASSTFPFYE